MSMASLSSLRVFSSMFNHFHCRDSCKHTFLRPVWMISVSWFSSQHVCYWHMGRLLIFVCSYCTLHLRWKSQQPLCVSWFSLQDFICLASRHLQQRIVWCLYPFYFLRLSLAETPNTVLSNSGKSEHSQFVPDFSRNILELCSSHLRS